MILLFDSLFAVVRAVFVCPATCTYNPNKELVEVVEESEYIGSITSQHYTLEGEINS